MLPGLMVTPRETAKVLSYVSQAYSLGEDKAYPTGIRAGDILLCIDLAANNTSPDAVTPSGFTNLFNRTGATGGTNFRTMVSAKVALGTESGTVAGIVDGTNRTRMFLLRPNWKVNGFAAIGSSTSTVSSAPVLVDLSLVGETRPLIVGLCAYINAVWPSMTLNVPMDASGPETWPPVAENCLTMLGFLESPDQIPAALQATCGDSGSYTSATSFAFALT